MSDLAVSNSASEPSGNTQTQKHTQPRHHRRQNGNRNSSISNGSTSLLATQGDTTSSTVTTRNAASSASLPESSGGSVDGHRRPRRPPPNRQARDSNTTTGTGAAQMHPRSANVQDQNVRGRDRNSARQSQTSRPDSVHSTKGDTKSSDTRKSTKGPGRRGARQFGASLTEKPEKASASTSTANVKPSEKFRSTAPKKDDLTSTLIHALSTSPYLDCLICFSAIHPAQPTWSCSPSSPSIPASDDEGTEKATRIGSARCCWTTFHLKCIRSWAAKSVKQVADAWRARGEDKPGDWRCPGCQSKRTAVASSYWCFCGSTPEPKPPRLATPHSCANPCSRPRLCGHPCPLLCHPGPCPPCIVITELPCHCNREILSFRCAQLTPGLRTDLSCHQTCGKPLGCGRHTCAKECHEGDCGECEVREMGRCWCGKNEEERKCGDEEVECVVLEGGQEKRWSGRFACDEVCGRPFDCGMHHCAKACHTPSLIRSPCPRTPSLITHCPCGKHHLDPSSAPYFPHGTLLTRTACTDPIPTCESMCMKPLEGCSHPCSIKCHTGPCPPCGRMVVRPCRCGSTTRNIQCSEDQRRSAAHHGPSSNDANVDEILCDRPCGALRACGRHQCNRLCCPLASLASVSKKKGKKPATKKSAAGDSDAMLDDAGWHECDLVCGRMLGCGNHRCEEKDHKGPCPPCLRSSFEEMICNCGRTVLEPPVPCGTRINCTYPCARPLLLCGHPKVAHACHEDPTPCPPCPFLTAKTCACSKKQVDNIRCSQERVSCGIQCGRLLSCGFHRCERLCHGDPCGPCNTSCGKSRKLCLPNNHPCTDPCHAPASCSEAEPCRAIINLTCPCGRIVQPVPCGRSTTNPTGREGSIQLKCSNECHVAKRNARLAEALGINPERGRDREVTYTEDLITFARANPKFCAMVEKSFSDFLSSERRSQILPQMPETRRKFVQDLAAVYRMDTQLVDQEPHRSVQLMSRIDSRVPSPLLSSAVGTSSSSSSSLVPSHSLGKLADLRAPVPKPVRSRVLQAPAPKAPAGRGWTSVVARQSGQGAHTAASPNAWMLQGPTAHLTQAPSSAPSPRSMTTTPVPVAPGNSVHADVGDVPESWEDDP